MMNANTSLRIRPPAIRKHLSGFTLVELMISLVLGLIMISGTIQIFVSNKSTYRYQQNISVLRENARFSIGLLSQTARMAGYRGDTPAEWVDGPITNTGGQFAIDGANDDASSSNTIKDDTDSFTVAFEGNSDGQIKDCQGNVIGSGVMVTNTFAVSTADELVCSIDSGLTWMTLISGVENMQLQYGLDSDGNQSANRYVTYPNIADTSDVVSLRAALLLQTDSGNIRQSADTQTYTLLDKVIYDGSNNPADGRVRQVIMTTIKLRNRL